jgi:hypothetical protein
LSNHESGKRERSCIIRSTSDRRMGVPDRGVAPALADEKVAAW